MLLVGFEPYVPPGYQFVLFAPEVRQQQETHEQKEQIDNLEERTAQNRQVTNTQPQQQVTQETVTREAPKIGRNDKVIIKNITNGETQTVKFKQALPLLQKGGWVVVGKG